MKPTVPVVQKKFANEQEYFLFEEKTDSKHELVNGNLIAMNGVSFEHNEITLTMAVLLKQLLKGAKWKIAIEAVKAKTPEGNFFYPDLMVCHPNPDKFFSAQPVLLIEVLSPSTRKYDMVDKFLQYQKIEALQYVLCIEPEQQAVIFYYRDAEKNWQADTYTKETDVVKLPQLNINFTLKQIYKPD